MASVVGGVMLLAVLLLGYLHTDSGQSFVRSQVVTVLGDRVNGTVELSALEFRLGGEVMVGGLTIRDVRGNSVITLQELRLRPDWWSLPRGTKVIESVRLRGLAVDAVRNADGSTNLSTLFKPRPPRKPGGAPSRDRFIVRAIDVGDVDLTLVRPNGTRLAVEDIVISASLDTVPKAKTVALSVPTLGASLSLAAAGGTTFRLANISTGLDLSLRRGAGTAKLHALKASAELDRKGAPPFRQAVALDGVTVDLKPDELGAALKKLALGVLVLESLEIDAGVADGRLSDHQSVTLVGLALDKKRVNDLLGREVLASDIDVRAKIGGPPEALKVSLDANTDGGDVSLAGTVDLTKLDHPSYELELGVKKLATERLVAQGATARLPPIEIAELTLDVDGRGLRKSDLDVTAKLGLDRARVRGVPIERAELAARLKDGVVHIDDLTVSAFGQSVQLSGSYRLGDKHLHAKVAPAADVGATLAALRSTGLPIRTKLPRGAVRAVSGEFEVGIEGPLDGTLAVRLEGAKLRILGGSARLTGGTSLSRSADGARQLGELDLTLSLSGVSLSRAAAIRGRSLGGYDGSLGGRVRVRGTKEAPRIGYQIEAWVWPRRGGREEAVQAVLEGTATRRLVDVSLAVRRSVRGRAVDDLATLEAKVPIVLSGGRRGIASGREARLVLDVPKRSVASLSGLLPGVSPLLLKLSKGKIAAHIDVHGKTDALEGSIDVRASGRFNPYAPGKRQRLVITGELAPTQAGSRLATTVKAWLDREDRPAVDLDLGVELARSPVLGSAFDDVRWSVVGDVNRQDLSELPLPADRKRGLKGGVGARVDLRGTKTDVGGSVAVQLDRVHRGRLGPIDGQVRARVRDASTTLGAELSLVGLRVLEVDGSVDVAGRGLIPRARGKALGDPAVRATLTVPRRRVSEWRRVRSSLGRLPGTVGGRIDVSGTVRRPIIEGGLAWNEFVTLAGRPGEVALALIADERRIAAEVGAGPEGGGAHALTITATTPREALERFLRPPKNEPAKKKRSKKAGGLLGRATAAFGSETPTAGRTLEVTLGADASEVDVRALVPRVVLEGKPVDAKGRLDWAMGGAVVLRSDGESRQLERAGVEGTLRLSRGSVDLVGAGRRYRDVALRLDADSQALRLVHLRARESDREKKSRRLDVAGSLRWKDLRPRQAELDVKLRDWLVFGTEALGETDAPRMAVSGDVSVKADLTRRIRRVEAVVRTLDVVMPDRFDKAHWPEKAHLGDVIEVSGQGSDVGSLPRSKPQPKPAKAAKVAKAPPPPGAPTGMDLFVRVPKPIAIQKTPFKFVAHGGLAVKLRDREPTRTIQGELRVVDGYFSLGGRNHLVDKKKKSTIRFDADHPTGELDVHFAYAPHPAVLRDVSKASAGGDVSRLHLGGSPGKPVVIVSGVANADLFDMLPVYNAGRVKHVSAPDMPASQTVQIPRGYDVLLISYMAVNLPHNLFLDRISAWADAHDERWSYGEIRHLEAERYSDNGKTRVRAEARPPAVGRSDADLSFDYLIVNEPRTKMGTGLTVGNRLGGGPGVFFEWSSAD